MENTETSLIENYRAGLKLLESELASVMYDEKSGEFLFVQRDNDPAWEILGDLHGVGSPSSEVPVKEMIEKINKGGEFSVIQIDLLREYLRFFWLLSANVIDFCFAEPGEQEDVTDYSIYIDFDGQRIYLLFRNDCSAESPIGKRTYSKRGLKDVYIGGGLSELVSNECAFKGIPEPAFNIEII